MTLECQVTDVWVDQKGRRSAFLNETQHIFLGFNTIHHSLYVWILTMVAILPGKVENRFFFLNPKHSCHPS